VTHHQNSAERNPSIIGATQNRRDRLCGDFTFLSVTSLILTKTDVVHLLMAQYNGQTVVPLDQVCRDFFGHLTVEKLLRKALRGDIALPIVRIETSQKAQRGVHLIDLAAYIDKRRAGSIEGMPSACRKELEQQARPL
jgi:hypothetical protein